MKAQPFIILFFCLSFWSNSVFAQFDAVELLPGISVPVFNEADRYTMGWALNCNYYYDDASSYSLYGGLGVHNMRVRNEESGYFPFYALQSYYGAQLKFEVKQEIFDIALGGELGYMIRFYTGNNFTQSFNLFIESSLGIAPKLAFHWRPGGSWCTIGFQCKYNAYFSLGGAFYSGSWQDGIHQWVQPGISVKAYL